MCCLNCDDRCVERSMRWCATENIEFWFILCVICKFAPYRAHRVARKERILSIRSFVMDMMNGIYCAIIIQIPMWAMTDDYSTTFVYVTFISKYGQILRKMSKSRSTTRINTSIIFHLKMVRYNWLELSEDIENNFVYAEELFWTIARRGIMSMRIKSLNLYILHI